MTSEVWVRICAIGIMVVGVVWIRRREFTVEIEGEEPFATVRGRTAIASGAVVIILGLILLVWPRILS